jgi:hypothetical protein
LNYIFTRLPESPAISAVVLRQKQAIKSGPEKMPLQIRLSLEECLCAAWFPESYFAGTEPDSGALHPRPIRA